MRELWRDIFCLTHRKSHRSIHYQLDQTCEECGKIIRGKHNLNQHLKEIHSLETSYNVNKVTVKTYPHTCDQCDAVFKRKSHLNSHVQGMHGWGKYPCSQCGKEFKNKSNLNRHVKNIHQWFLIAWIENKMFCKNNIDTSFNLYNDTVG